MRRIFRHNDARSRTRLMADSGGVTAIEFALIAPVMMGLIMGIVEFSLIAFTSSVMDAATTMTARLGKTGYVPPNKTRQQAIIDSITDKTAGLLDPNKITITTEVFSNWNSMAPEPCIKPTTPPCPGTPGVNFVDVNGNGVWDANPGSAGLGNAGDIVVYTVTYPWPITTPGVSAFLGSTFTITSRTVVKNEPYGGS